MAAYLTEIGSVVPVAGVFRGRNTIFNRSGDSTVVVPSEYLEVVVSKR